MFEKDTCCLLLFVCVFMLVLIYFDSDSSGVVEGQGNIQNKPPAPEQQVGSVVEEEEDFMDEEGEGSAEDKGEGGDKPAEGGDASKEKDAGSE